MEPRQAGNARAVQSFLDDVEREIEALDPSELIEFLEADSLPIEPRPAFESALRAHLLSGLHTRFAH